MILEAIRRSNGQFCTMFDAHPDPEIFRIRLGRALNFEFFEDYIGGMFSSVDQEIPLPCSISNVLLISLNMLQSR